MQVTTDPARSERPTLAWTGSEYAVAWSDVRHISDEIYLARLDGDGVKVGVDVRLTTMASISVHPAVAWSGSELAVAWQDNIDTHDTNHEIYFARYTPLGDLVGTTVVL